MSTSSIYTLGEIRLTCQQRTDMVNSQFISDSEWNSYINNSYFELYDLLVGAYGDDYYVANPYTYTMDGTNFQYALPNDFYKAIGVDVLLMGSNFYVPIKSFNFGDRTPNFYIGSVPSAGQRARLWYIPRMAELVDDADEMDGVSGWEEYIVCDVAIKALAKEESDPSVFMAQKQALKVRIQSMASNRDAGNPMSVTDSQAQAYGWPFAISSLYAPNILRYRVTGSKVWFINYGIGVGYAG